MPAVVLAIVALALLLFWKEWVSIEVTSLLVVFLLAVTGALSPEEAFAGFADDTVVFIFTLLAMARGLAATGVVREVGARLGFLARLGRTGFLAGTMLVVAAFSALVSNTATVAAFLPIVISGSARAGVPARQALMPLSFASMLGGTILLFGTSTNLVMSGVMERAGLGAIGVAELAPAGLVICAAGIVLTLLLAPRLLAGGEEAGQDEELPPRRYVAELTVPSGSRHVGRPLGDVAQELGAGAVAVVKREGEHSADPARVVAPEDRVLIEGAPHEILEAADTTGVEPPAASAARPAQAENDPDAAAAPSLLVVEAAVPPGSSLAGRSSEESRLAERLGVEILALHHRAPSYHLTLRRLLRRARRAPRLAALPVSVGDVLLLRAPAERVRELASRGTLLVLAGLEHEPARRSKAVLSILIFVGVLALGSAKVVPMSVAGLGGLLAMIVTGCVDARRALSVEWRVVLLIGSMLGLGLAIERSGAAELVGAAVAQLASLGGPRTVLVVLALVTVLLSAPMSNQAAALVVFPIAVSAAARLGIDPRPLAIGVTLAGSCSFMTPLEPASLLVLGAGRYRFGDFVRAGAPLTLAVLVVIAVAVPAIWPFAAR